MSSIGKQIDNTEANLLDVESALDVAISQKDQTELARKRSKLIKKLNKLKRKRGNESHRRLELEQDDRDWR
jgi:hypothetical protein